MCNLEISALFTNIYFYNFCTFSKYRLKSLNYRTIGKYVVFKLFYWKDTLIHCLILVLYVTTYVFFLFPWIVTICAEERVVHNTLSFLCPTHITEVTSPINGLQKFFMFLAEIL